MRYCEIFTNYLPSAHKHIHWYLVLFAMLHLLPLLCCMYANRIYCTRFSFSGSTLKLLPVALWCKKIQNSPFVSLNAALTTKAHQHQLSIVVVVCLCVGMWLAAFSSSLLSRSFVWPRIYAERLMFGNKSVVIYFECEMKMRITCSVFAERLTYPCMCLVGRFTCKAHHRRCCSCSSHFDPLVRQSYYRASSLLNSQLLLCISFLMQDVYDDQVLLVFCWWYFRCSSCSMFRHKLWIEKIASIFDKLHCLLSSITQAHINRQTDSETQFRLRLDTVCTRSVFLFFWLPVCSTVAATMHYQTLSIRCWCWYESK